jgi:heme/copper-type cytochrome/quinol oxidase subunit 3
VQYLNRQIPLSEEEQAQREQERQQREAEVRMKNNRLGITVFQISWIMIFICLVIVYWQLGFQPGWTPKPEQAPGVLLPTVATLALLVSGWLARRALQTVQRSPAGSRPAFSRDWLIALLLGSAFFVIMLTQYFAVPASDNGEQFGYVYRLMIGYHALHAIAIGYMMLRVWQNQRLYHSENYWSVEAAAKLWYFVVGAWLMFFAVLYLPFLL